MRRKYVLFALLAALLPLPALASYVGTFSGGSILFADSNGNIAQSNANLYWNNTSAFLGIGTASPITSLDVYNAVNGGVRVVENITGPGTVSNAAGGTTVTGVGTTFTKTFAVGDSIVIPTAGGNGVTTQQSVAISAIASDTSMTTASITNANSGVAYDPIAFTSVGVNQSTPMIISGTTNKFLQHQIINNSTGGDAQAGYTATTNTGTDTSGFIGLYINGSGYTNAAGSAYNIGAAGDGSVTCLATGKDCYFGNLDSAGNVYLFSGGNAITSHYLQMAATGAVSIKSALATAFTVGLNGVTNPVLTVDASVGSQATGLSIQGAATAGTTNLTVTDSGSAASLAINAKGTGTIALGNVSTGAVTVTPALNLGGALQTLTKVLGSSTVLSTCAEAGTGSPTCSYTNSAGSFTEKITLASSASATSITLTFPNAAANMYICDGFDATTTTIRLKQTGGGTGTAVLTYYNDAGTATSPGATDILYVKCLAN